MAEDSGPTLNRDDERFDRGQTVPDGQRERRRPGRQNYTNEELINLLRDPAGKLQKIEIELLTDELERRRGPMQPVLLSAFLFWVVLDLVGLLVWWGVRHQI